MTRNALGRVFCLFLLFACDDASKDPSDAGADDSGPALPEWITNERQSEDLNRYGEAFCRNEGRCFDGDFRECNLNNLAAFCLPGLEATKVPNLDACLKALAERECGAGVTSECLGARNALRSSGDNRLLAEGEPCGPSNVIRCDFDLHCDADANQCGTCRKLGVSGDSCRSSSECLATAFFCLNGRCASRRARGQSCDPLAFECELGLVCTDDLCAENEDPPTRSARIGSACSEDSECYSNTCDEGKCVARTRCSSGEQGERCSYAYSCVQGHTCEPFTLRCVPALAAGETCDPNASLCELGTVCIDEVCTAQIPNGKACEYTGALYTPECASGFCEPEGKCGPQAILCPSSG